MPEGADKALATLRWFVFRARRVAEHSLVVDRNQLLSWARGTRKITVVDCVPRTLDMHLPDEEAFESLAGRVRPFLMPSDQLYFDKVLKDLRPYLDSNDELAEALTGLRERWSRFDSKSGQTLGYAMRTGRAEGPLGALLADTTLADAWLYCDFGHGDTDVTDRVGENGLDDRYAAAVLLVSNIAVCTVAALNLIHRAWEAGLLPLDEGVFTESVLARTEISRSITAFASAPVGTPVHVLEEALGRHKH